MIRTHREHCVIAQNATRVVTYGNRNEGPVVCACCRRSCVSTFGCSRNVTSILMPLISQWQRAGGRDTKLRSAPNLDGFVRGLGDNGWRDIGRLNRQKRISAQDRAAIVCHSDTEERSVVADRGDRGYIEGIGRAGNIYAVLAPLVRKRRVSAGNRLELGRLTLVDG